MQRIARPNTICHLLVHDSEALANFKDALGSALTLIQSYITKKDGIELESAQGKKLKGKENCNQNLAEDLQAGQLPKPPKRSKYAGRVGHKANENAKLTNVKKSVNKLTKKPYENHISDIPRETERDFQTDSGVKEHGKSLERKEQVDLVAKKEDNV